MMLLYTYNNEMIATVKLINISMSLHSYHFCWCVVKAPEIYSLRKFPVYNTILLTIIIMLYIRSLELIHPT